MIDFDVRNLPSEDEPRLVVGTVQTLVGLPKRPANPMNLLTTW